jgi:hypothetical protein
MISRVVQTVLSNDGERCLEFYERDDHRFSFIESMRTVSIDGEPAWTPAWPSPSPICDTLDTARHEAAARIDWLSEIPN